MSLIPGPATGGVIAHAIYTDGPNNLGCVAAASDEVRILFNCPEGTQRSIGEYHGVRLNKFTHVFLTRVEPGACMGLPGMSFTVNDVGVKSLLVGAPDLDGFVRDFWQRTLQPAFYRYRDFNLLAAWDDSTAFVPITVSPGLRAPPPSAADQHTFVTPSSVNHSKGTSRLEATKALEAFPMSVWALRCRYGRLDGAVHGGGAEERAAHSVVGAAPFDGGRLASTLCYWVHVAAVPQFSPLKAKGCGVLPGKKYSVLKGGQPVLSDTEPRREVQPHEVHDTPATPATSVCVFDAVSLREAEAWLNAFEETRRQSDVSEESSAGGANLWRQSLWLASLVAVYHVAEPAMVRSAPYQILMDRFTRLAFDAATSSPLAGSRAGGPRPIRHVIAHRSDVEASIVSCPTALVHRLHLRHLLPLASMPLPDAWVASSAEPGAASEQPPCLPTATATAPRDDAMSLKSGDNIPATFAPPLFAHEPIAMSLLSDEFMEAWPLRRDDASVAAAGAPEPSMPIVGGSVEDAGRIVQRGGSNMNVEAEQRRAAWRLGQPFVTLLGTGSAVPSKYRNVSCVLLHGTVRRAELVGNHAGVPRGRDDTESFFGLLDAGEGSLGQLWQHRGTAFMERVVLPRLAFIWVSHMHPDHNLGIFSILMHRLRVKQQLQRESAQSGVESISDSRIRPSPPFPTVALCGPAAFEALFRQLATTVWRAPGYPEGPSSCSSASLLGQEGIDFEFWSVPPITSAPPAPPSAFHCTIPLVPFSVDGTNGGSGTGTPSPWFAGMQPSHPAIRLFAFYVDHPADALGLRVEWPSAASNQPVAVVYSGDTRPCSAVVEAARGASLLIHESTFGCDLLDDAIAKKHATVDEAVEVAVASGCPLLLLTHFSQRYPKVPNVGSSGGRDGAGDATTALHIVVGFDHLCVPIADFTAAVGRRRRVYEHPSEGHEPTTADVTSELLCGELHRALPALQALMLEYERWSRGTSKRLRDAVSSSSSSQSVH